MPIADWRCSLIEKASAPFTPVSSSQIRPFPIFFPSFIAIMSFAMILLNLVLVNRNGISPLPVWQAHRIGRPESGKLRFCPGNPA
jgi:hypothetical protein